MLNLKIFTIIITFLFWGSLFAGNFFSCFRRSAQASQESFEDGLQIDTVKLPRFKIEQWSDSIRDPIKFMGTLLEDIADLSDCSGEEVREGDDITIDGVSIWDMVDDEDEFIRPIPIEELKFGDVISMRPLSDED